VEYSYRHSTTGSVMSYIIAIVLKQERTIIGRNFQIDLTFYLLSIRTRYFLWHLILWPCPLHGTMFKSHLLLKFTLTFYVMKNSVQKYNKHWQYVSSKNEMMYLNTNTKWRFLFTFELLPLQLNPLSQSIKRFQQKISTQVANCHPVKNTEE